MLCSDDYALRGHNSILSVPSGQRIRAIKPEFMHSLRYQLHTAAQIRAIEARAMQPIQQRGMGLGGDLHRRNWMYELGGAGIGTCAAELHGGVKCVIV